MKFVLFFTKPKRLAILSIATCALWFVGCGSDGNISKGGGGENRAVTLNNLNEFLQVFQAAYYYDIYKLGSAGIRGKRDNRPAEYGKEEENYTNIYTIIGKTEGRIEVKETEIYFENWSENNDIETGGVTGEYKYFDFSNTGDLYLGGAIGILDKWEEKNWIATETLEINGTINFQGKFKGRLVFEKARVVYKYDGGKETVTTSGNSYLESYDTKTVIDFDYDLFEILYNPRGKENDYGEQKITITMPAVPNVPNGSLTSRGGAGVSADNVNAFFAAFEEEFNDSYNQPRSVEEKEIWEELEHGRVSGYVKYKEEGKSQGASESNTGRHYSGTITIEYVDYSNVGRLYFGGGVAEAYRGFFKFIGNPYSEIGEDTTIINGKVKFNGEFVGELDFQNFKYVYESDYDGNSGGESYKRIGGKVSIGGLDVTQDYIDKVIKY
jgi:hypothetical protein